MFNVIIKQPAAICTNLYDRDVVALH